MKKLFSFIFATLLLTQMLVPLPINGFVPQASAQNSNRTGDEYAEKIEKIEEFVQKQMKSDQAVGLTIGFIKDDFRWVKGFGYADLENKVPAKPESSYRMASVTKPMTAVAILTLVEQGKIDLDAEVQTYLPYFPKKKYPVTVRQLLGHLGGISHYRNYALEGHFKNHKNTREAIRVFEDFELVAEPGTRYNYSSYGFNLLGAVIEGASGKSYGEYMTENVWKPLGMNATVLDDPLKIIPNRVEGYRLINGRVGHSEFVDISSRFAAGGIRSTVPDMLDFAKGMKEGKLLNDKMRYQMWTTQATREGRNVNYGYGWNTNTGNGRFIVGHGGAQAETRTYLMVVPHQKFAAAVAINFENANSFAYARKIFEIILDEPWTINYYAKDQKDEMTLNGIDTAFETGMRHYNQFSSPLAKSEAELAEAFSYFNESLKADGREMQQKLARGSHPASKEAFVKMVSFMADKLKQNGKELDIYYNQGVLSFFADYINWYKTQSGYPDALTFEKSFEDKLANWNSDWAKTWNGETRNLEINALTDFDAVSKKLSQTFSGASVYPNFVREMDDLVVSTAIAGDLNKAAKIAQTNYALYPDSHQTTATMGILLTISGEKDKAKAMLQKSLALNPRGGASAGRLNGAAYDLLSIGQTEAGLNVLMIAVELHPKVANLYDSIGEFYMNLKQNGRAIEFYEKALQVDPNYANASVAKETIEKLKAMK